MQKEKQKKDLMKVENKIKDPDTNQIAYALNLNNWSLIISNSGHGKMTRGKDRRDFCGGWVWTKSGRITFTCGLLSKVPDHFKETVKACIENELRVFLKEY